MSKAKVSVKVKYIEGDTIKGVFPDTSKIKHVVNWIKKKSREEQKRTLRKYLYEKGSYRFVLYQPHPPRTFDAEKEEKILGELFPDNMMNVVIQEKGEEIDVKKGEGSIENAKIKEHSLVSTALKGDSMKEKEDFERKKKMREAEKKKIEAEEKELNLLKIRTEIEADKLNRLDKVWVKEEKKEEEE